MIASIGAVLEIQTVDRLFVVPRNLTRYHLHYLIQPLEGQRKMHVSVIFCLISDLLTLTAREFSLFSFNSVVQNKVTRS